MKIKALLRGWMAAFITILPLLMVLSPWLTDKPVWLKALVLSLLMVFLVQRVTLPLLQRIEMHLWPR